MKAILEFNYPEDENKLRRAVHADKAFDALEDMQAMVSGWHTHTKADYEELLGALRSTIHETRKQTGEINA